MVFTVLPAYTIARARARARTLVPPFCRALEGDKKKTTYYLPAVGGWCDQFSWFSVNLVVTRCGRTVHFCSRCLPTSLCVLWFGATKAALVTRFCDIHHLLPTACIQMVAVCGRLRFAGAFSWTVVVDSVVVMRAELAVLLLPYGQWLVLLQPPPLYPTNSPPYPSFSSFYPLPNYAGGNTPSLPRNNVSSSENSGYCGFLALADCLDLPGF